MIKKQNRTPNLINRQKKYSNKTPDSLSSRGTFKPKFIVKNPPTDINYDHVLAKSQNTVILDQILSSNSPLYHSKETQDYKKKYENLKEDIMDRTQNFNEVIQLCSNIIMDIHKNSRINKKFSPQKMENKLNYINKKTKCLLQTFYAFQKKNQN